MTPRRRSYSCSKDERKDSENENSLIDGEKQNDKQERQLRLGPALCGLRMHAYYSQG